jgi:hypothetical protein
MSVNASWIKHRIPSFGFVIEKKNLFGKYGSWLGILHVFYVINELPVSICERLNTEKLKQRGLTPGPLFAKLKSGQTVELPNGEKVIEAASSAVSVDSLQF